MTAMSASAVTPTGSGRFWNKEKILLNECREKAGWAPSSLARTCTMNSAGGETLSRLVNA